ncbi:MAG: M28 family peptidase [Bacteroidetes bacterium]|nr:M28 family peptidase [Bacteroidota bacterium]
MRTVEIVFLSLILPALVFAQKDTTAIRYSNIIKAENLKTHLTIIASDAYEGRETGKKGQKMAAQYIRNQFKSFGIPPYKDTTYYQTYPLNMIMPVPANLSINGKKFEGNKDFYNFPGLSAQEIVDNSVLFLGYGIEEEVYNDYKKADISGKVIMILEGEPYKDGLSLITKSKSPSLWTTYGKGKIEKIRERGAKALFIIVESVANGMEDNKHRLETPSLKLDLSRKEMPVIYISKTVADEILKKSTVQQLKEKISKSGKPVKKKARAETIIKIENNVQKIEAENVLGYVEGSDLKEEVVVITAHYDHLGKEGDIVYNGADDDGSGTVAVIQLAEAFAKAKKEGHGPRRSMLFMTVSGEEKGLLGSAYYTEHPEFPLKNTVCDLNIDMIGRLDEKHSKNTNYIYLIGSDKLSSDLHKISEKANKTYSQLELDYTFNDEKDKNRFYYRSDHYNFAKKGVPVIFYFNGVHADYHKETDEVEKIDFQKMEKITRLVFFTAWEIANRTERIKVDSKRK